jgi:hypothetical protein
LAYLGIKSPAVNIYILNPDNKLGQAQLPFAIPVAQAQQSVPQKTGRDFGSDGPVIDAEPEYPEPADGWIPEGEAEQDVELDELDDPRSVDSSDDVEAEESLGMIHSQTSKLSTLIDIGSLQNGLLKVYVPATSASLNKLLFFFCCGH